MPSDIWIPYIRIVIQTCRKDAVLFTVPIKWINTFFVLLRRIHFLSKRVLRHVPQENSSIHASAYKNVVLLYGKKCSNGTAVSFLGCLLATFEWIQPFDSFHSSLFAQVPGINNSIRSSTIQYLMLWSPCQYKLYIGCGNSLFDLWPRVFILWQARCKLKRARWARFAAGHLVPILN